MVTVIFVVCLGIVFTALPGIDNCHKRTLSPGALFGQDIEVVCVCLCVGYGGMCLQSVLQTSVSKCWGVVRAGEPGLQVLPVCDCESSATFDVEVTVVHTSVCFPCLSQPTSILFVAVEDHSTPPPPPRAVCLTPVGWYRRWCSAAPELSPPPGSQRGGPLTAKATEVGSQLIGSCVSGTETCRSQHFSSCFPCRPLLLPSPSAALAHTDTVGLTVGTHAGCLYQRLEYSNGAAQ